MPTRRCPNCGRFLRNDPELTLCPGCAHDLRATGNEDYSEQDEAHLDMILWEDRGEVGGIKALLHTLRNSMFRPTEFFATVPTTGGLCGPLLFFVFIQAIATMFSAYYLALQGIFQGQELLSHMELPENSLVPLVVFGLGALLTGVVISIFLISLIYQLCLFLVGAGPVSFEGTFRVIAYSAGPSLMSVFPPILPLLSGLLGIVAAAWQIMLYVKGFAGIHGISGARAFGAVAVSFALGCCFAVTLAGLLVGILPK